jgi:hypothetical protein
LAESAKLIKKLNDEVISLRFRKPERYLSRAEKLLREAGYSLNFRYVKTDDGLTARDLESQLLRDYEQEHWELPPSNATLPRPKKK